MFLIDYRPPGLVSKYIGSVSGAQLEAHEAFCRAHLPQTDRVESLAEVRQLVARLQLDAAFTGSDAVFRLDYRLGREDTTFPNPFWLAWGLGPNVITGSVAASAMGTNFLGLPGDVRRGVRRAVAAMSFVTTRDYWTSWMLTLLTYGRVRAQFLPDPVLTLSSAWDAVSEGRVDIYPNPYVVLSAPSMLLNEQWVRAFTDQAHASGFDVVGLPMPEGDLPPGPLDHRVSMPVDPLEWYRWIACSKGYVGVRFHPIVVAMANAIPFVAVDLYQRPRRLPFLSKTYDLSFRTGLRHRCLSRSAFKDRTSESIWSLLMRHVDRDQARQKKFHQRALALYETRFALGARTA